MIQNGMYYMTDEYKDLVCSLGGEWNDRKKRPIVCLLQSTENPDLYWAILQLKNCWFIKKVHIDVRGNGSYFKTYVLYSNLS